MGECKSSILSLDLSGGTGGLCMPVCLHSFTHPFIQLIFIQCLQWARHYSMHWGASGNHDEALPCVLELPASEGDKK